MPHFVDKPVLNHPVHALLDIIIQVLPFIGKDKVIRVICGLLHAFGCIVRRDFLPCLPVELDGANHALYIVGMDFLCGLRVAFLQYVMDILCPFSQASASSSDRSALSSPLS